MRILLINYEYPPVGAGAATASEAIGRALVAAGHSVTVLTTGFGELRGTREEEGIRVIRVASSRLRRESATIYEMISFLFCATNAVRGVVRSENIDAMIAFFSFPSGPAAWWAHRDKGVPYVVSLRGGDVPGADSRLRIVHWCLGPFRRQILRSARAVVANSPGLKTMSERIDPVPVHMIPNGVDTEFFVPERAPHPKRCPFRMLFVGRFQAQKNLFWLLDRLAAARDAGTPSFTLDLVGDGPQRPALATRAADLQLEDIVHFHGWQDRVALRAHYQAADLLVNPSVYEGMPNVVLEAMACGCPVLASRVPGNDTVVVDRVSGWLFTLDDAADFVASVRSLISQPEVILRLGFAARERAVREYSWTRTAQSYLELLACIAPISQIA